MKRLLFVVLYIVSILQICYSQALPYEKIFVCSDCTDYQIQDTVRIHGQIISADSLRPYSKYLYVEVYNDKDSLFLRQKLVTDSLGGFRSRMPIGYDWKQGIYYVRAYSRMMQNYSSETMPIFPIRIGLTSGNMYKAQSDIFCSFFPEGGHLQLGCPQKIAVCLTDSYGLPVEANYTIMNQLNDTICKQKTTRSGWQTFQLSAHAGNNYRLEAKVNAVPYIFLLPEACYSPLIQSTFNGNRVIYNICGADDNLKELTLYIFHHHLGLQQMPLKQAMGVFEVDGLPDGLLSMMLADKRGNIISQSFQWIDRTKPDNFIDELVEKSLFSKGEKLFLPETCDTTLSVISLRIMPKTDLYVPKAEVLLNWESDLTSVADFPKYYAEEETRERMIDLNSWLCSANFKRLDVKKAVKDGFRFKFLPETKLELNGQVKTRSGHALKQGSIVGYCMENGSTTDTSLDDNGCFTLGIPDFSDKESFFIEAYNKKGEEDVYTYSIESDTLLGMMNWNRVLEISVGHDITLSGSGTFGFDKINDIPEVVIEAKVKAEKYVPTNRFYSTRYIDAEQMEKSGIQDFKQLIQKFYGFMNLVTTIDKKSGTISYWLKNNRGLSTLGKSNGIKILLDGVTITADEAMNLNINEIETAELLAPWQTIRLMGGVGAMDGAFVLKTKGVKRQNIPAKGIFYTPIGLSNLRCMKQKWEYRMPQKTGTYKIIIDVLSAKTGIGTYEKEIQVTD